MPEESQTPNQPPRKPRGKHIPQTALMKALDDDPAAAMMALADETVSEWENTSPKETKDMLDALDTSELDRTSQ